MENYYKDKELQEFYGWENEFDFSSWVYDDSQELIYKQFKYYLERGVSPEFVIETMRARSEDGWYPRRKELLKANIIIDILGDFEKNKDRIDISINTNIVIARKIVLTDLSNKKEIKLFVK